MRKTYHQKVKYSNFLISDDEEIAFPISEYNVQLRILKRILLKSLLRNAWMK